MLSYFMLNCKKKKEKKKQKKNEQNEAIRTKHSLKSKKILKIRAHMMVVCELNTANIQTQ